MGISSQHSLCYQIDSFCFINVKDTFYPPKRVPKAYSLCCVYCDFVTKMPMVFRYLNVTIQEKTDTNIIPLTVPKITFN